MPAAPESVVMRLPEPMLAERERFQLGGWTSEPEIDGFRLTRVHTHTTPSKHVAGAASRTGES